MQCNPCGGRFCTYCLALAHLKVHIRYGMPLPFDAALAAQQLLRGLRGERSQVALSRRLGYRGNVVAGWEAGRRFPTLTETLRFCCRIGIDVDAVMRGFDPQATAAAEGSWRDLRVIPRLLPTWLQALRGRQAIGTIAERCGRSRFVVGRWIAGTTMPRLPDFLQLLEALTQRCSDWVGALLPVERVAALMPLHQARTLARQLAYVEPWTEAVLRVLETSAYDRLPMHQPGWIATRLGIDRATETRCLRLLHAARLVQRRRKKYVPVEVLSVDTRADPTKVRELKAHWAQVVAQALLAPESPSRALGGDVEATYNVVSCSHADLQRIRLLREQCYHEIRAIIAQSQPCESVALLVQQLIEWPVTSTP